MQKTRKFSSVRELMIFAVVALVFTIMTFASEYFLSWDNLLALLLGMSLDAIMVIGMTNLMVSGGFDMSIGSTVGLSGGVTATLLKTGLPIWLCIIGGLLTGAAIGAVNGIIVAKMGINPFVTTLAMLNMGRGLLLVLTNGKNISNLPDSFTWIGQSKIGSIQLPIIFAIVLVIIGDVILRKSRFFRQNYYIGGNEKAAILSGIHVTTVKIFNYIFMGVLAAFSGIVLTARLGSASTTAGQGQELKVITAVIIGGASLAGGEGTILGAFLGTFLMAMITNAMTLLNVSVYWQTFVIGLTLLIAVLIDRIGKKRGESRK